MSLPKYLCSMTDSSGNVTGYTLNSDGTNLVVVSGAMDTSSVGEI